ncbi:hypothetical protein XU18_1306 [Perkinsela sp. CCAP 1560/4]|nr:hypothetical protein XU18_2326 [Perkinsela sp. CCAP 1560/4]KNH08140.1 hypothetical protein XU18_1306 [Perkinsela sp. CCAP 1560/4]|eukprot:KNH06895.1 hypothetical protein XU18_2326 [Perkinsela sp. CCAP 1560/4]
MYRRFWNYLTTRDPAANYLQRSALFMERIATHSGQGLAVLIVIGSLIYEQRKDPSKVRLPKFDGRSGVV